MTSSSTSLPDIGVTQDAANDATKARKEATVSRAGEANIHDDGNSKSRFLATFSAAEGAAIMKKVDRRFFVLIGLMYMIKQVSSNRGSFVA